MWQLIGRGGRSPAGVSTHGEARDVASGRLVRSLEGHKNWVWSVAFDRQGGTLASGSADRTVKLWDVASGRLLRTLEGHQDAVFSVAFDLQEGTLASGSVDNTVKLWDVASGRLLRTLEGHTGWVYAIAFSPDGALLASKSRDDTIRLWSCATWETVAIIPVPTRASILDSRARLSSRRAARATTAGHRQFAPHTPEAERSREIHLYELDARCCWGAIERLMRCVTETPRWCWWVIPESVNRVSHCG